MSTQKYSVNQPLIETLISRVKSGEIAVPDHSNNKIGSKTAIFEPNPRHGFQKVDTNIHKGITPV